MSYVIKNESEMQEFGKKIAKKLVLGDVLELIGDVGAGKTTLMKGLALGLGVADDVQSPSFTISRVYQMQVGELVHYDFYRLDDAGIMADELDDRVYEKQSIIAVEWADSVSGVLPVNRVVIKIDYAENGRSVIVDGIEL